MKKVGKVIVNILMWILILLAVCMMIFTIVSTRTFNNRSRTLFGYNAFIVLSDSMSKTDFSAGDVVLVKETDPATLKAGDIIAYESQNTDNYGAVVTHKIRKLTTDANGNPGFITYGTTTNTNDETVVTYANVIGKYEKRIPKAGKFFQFLKTTPGYILCIFIPFFILILIQVLHSIRLFRIYKKEQMEEIQKERTSLEAERAESKKIYNELQELKTKLGTAEGDSSGPGSQPAEETKPAEETQPEAETQPAADTQPEAEKKK